MTIIVDEPTEVGRSKRVSHDISSKRGGYCSPNGNTGNGRSGEQVAKHNMLISLFVPVASCDFPLCDETAAVSLSFRPPPALAASCP